MQSRILYKDQHYTVCLTRAGLSVEGRKGGKILPPTGKYFSDWVEAFDTAIDRDEARALARAIYN